MKSLCGNSYGCLSEKEGGIGTELSYNGEIICSRCMSIAIAVVEFLVGEEIEFMTVLGEWIKTREVMDRLLDTLLGRTLRAQGII